MRLKVSWILAVALIGAVSNLGVGCGDASDTGGTGQTTATTTNIGCTPGQSEACACAAGAMGVQVCQPDGTFGTCDCGGAGGSGGGGDGVCGNSVKESGETCDDGNLVDGDGCSSTCQSESTCPDGKPDPGECGAEGTCPMDCMLCGNGAVDPFECGQAGACPEDCCLPANTQIFAGFVPSSGPYWAYQGLSGTDAGHEQCKTGFNADHACTYEEIVEADKQAELGQVPDGTTFWLHRTTEVMVNGQPSPPGAGARCNDWTYPTNHASDGEWGEKQGGVLSYNFDNDSIFDQAMPHTIPTLQCGGEARAIFCCYAACVKPPVP
jgi:cysteine-rich repeat protein